MNKNRKQQLGVAYTLQYKEALISYVRTILEILVLSIHQVLKGIYKLVLIESEQSFREVYKPEWKKTDLHVRDTALKLPLMGS